MCVCVCVCVCVRLCECVMIRPQNQLRRSQYIYIYIYTYIYIDRQIDIDIYTCIHTYIICPECEREGEEKCVNLYIDKTLQRPKRKKEKLNDSRINEKRGSQSGSKRGSRCHLFHIYIYKYVYICIDVPVCVYNIIYTYIHKSMCI